MHLLHLENIAEKWDNGTPIGNGHMGCMLYGDPNCEKLYLCEESIWSQKDEDGLNPAFAEKIEYIKKLYLESSPVEAEKWAVENLKDDFHTIASNEYAGLLTLQFNEKSKITSYSRDLHLDSAIAKVSYKRNGKQFKHEAFSSNPDKIMAYRIKSESKHGFTLQYSRECLRTINTDDTSLFAVCDTAIGNHPFCVGIKVQTNGISEKCNNDIVVKNATDTIVWISIVTSFRCENFETECKNRLAVADKGYDTIKASHIADYQTIYNKSEINFNDESDRQKLPVNKRLSYLKIHPLKNDYSLASIYFNFGKYLLISSSREGSLPANLQGIWVEKMLNPWNADFHTNINLQMNYWPVEVANIQECAEPLFAYMNNVLLPYGKKTAEVNYNARGLVVHHLSDPYGFTAAADGIWGLWPLGGAWLAFHMWEHYLYTRDKEFLKETAYEYIKNAALFFMDTMFEDKNGRLLSGPSTSPENNFYVGKVSCNMCMSPTMDIEIIGGLLRFYIETENILHIDEETATLAKEKLAKMPPLQIGKHGQLMEWLEDYDEPEPGHRHISHAFALYPDHAINRNTPEFYKAIRKTIDRRLAHGGGHTGWSRAWLLCLFTRLHDAKAFEKNLRLLFTKSTLGNLLDTHPPFQIDGNFGATAAICESLVQGHEGRICLLPAVCEKRSGSFKGLLVHGGYEVSCIFENAKVISFDIQSAFDGAIRIELPASQKNAIINEQTADADGIFTFPCNSGNTYHFKIQ